MSDLNLAELDRLEREATDGPWPVDCLTIKTIHRWLGRHGAQRADEDIALVSGVRNQLRPLLDLVDWMGEVLSKLPHSAICRNEDGRWSGECLRCMALKDYRLAKDRVAA